MKIVYSTPAPAAALARDMKPSHMLHIAVSVIPATPNLAESVSFWTGSEFLAQLAKYDYQVGGHCLR